MNKIFKIRLLDGSDMTLYRTNILNVERFLNLSGISFETIEEVDIHQELRKIGLSYYHCDVVLDFIVEHFKVKDC